LIYVPGKNLFRGGKSKCAGWVQRINFFIDYFFAVALF